MRNILFVFFALAVAFITIGIRGQRTFLYVGIAFLAIFLLRWARRRT